MTLLQLKYAVTAATAGTISEAAKQLFITQPSLTSAIHELENELGITIFQRTNKGIRLRRGRRISRIRASGHRTDQPDRGAVSRNCTTQAPVLRLHTALFVCR